MSKIYNEHDFNYGQPGNFINSPINPINMRNPWPEDEEFGQEIREIIKGMYFYDPPIKYFLNRCIGPSTFHLRAMDLDHDELPIFTDSEKYQGLLTNLLTREDQLCKDYYIMYSAWPSDQNFYYDVLRLFKLLVNHHQKGISTKTVKIRKKSVMSVDVLFKKLNRAYPKGFHQFDEFVYEDGDTNSEKATPDGYWNDRRQEFIDYTISTNLFLFGNFPLPNHPELGHEKGEDSISYMTMAGSRSWGNEGTRDNLEKWLSTIVSDQESVKKFAKNLTQIYETNFMNQTYGIMNQFCIRKDANVIDRLCYLSLEYGEPVPDIKLSAFLNGLEKEGLIYVQRFLDVLGKKYPKYEKMEAQSFLHSVQARMIYDEFTFEDPNKIIVFSEYLKNNLTITSKVYLDILRELLKVVEYCWENPTKCLINQFQKTNIYKKIAITSMNKDTCTIQ